MRTKVLPEPILDVLKRNRQVYQAARKARMAVGAVIPPRRVAGVPGRVHVNDFMLEGRSPEAVAFYLQGARNVVALIDESLAAAGKGIDDVESWLDFGCGYGRVVRILLERVEPSKVAASDVIAEGVEFCATEFGVQPLHSQDRVADLRLGRFDFIYAISVLTHLDEENSVAMLSRLGEALNEGGLLMFTTHGRWSADNAGRYSKSCGRMRGQITRRLGASGIAFVPYCHYPGDAYGLTWHSQEYIADRMRDLHGDSMRRLFFKPRGLDDHQDAYCYERRRSTT